MKRKLELIEMTLVSLKEKKARKIKFHPDITVITGDNDTGKSSLIKSIYYTFGAELKIHPNWKKAFVIYLIKFKYDNKEYSLLRNQGEFALFDNKLNFIRLFHNVTNELGPYFSKMFNFHIRLPNQQGKSIIVPPAYCFLPFYIDQDLGWLGNWNSFERLSQLKTGWKRGIADFHTGARPSEYYDIKVKKDSFIISKSSLEDEIRILAAMHKKALMDFGDSCPSIDIGLFKKEIESLLDEIRKVKDSIEQNKNILIDLYNKRDSIKLQIEITTKTLSELKKDYHYTTEIEKEEEIDCPVCGANYHNSFAERFSIAKDEERCYELLSELRKDLSEIESKIELENKKFDMDNEEFKKIKSVLEIKKGDVKLDDLLKNEGKRNLLTIVKKSIKKIEEEIEDLNLKLEEIDKILMSIDSTKKRKEIKKIYLDLMETHLKELNVNSININDYERIDCKIKETGSDFPRALLAYYYTILNIIDKHSTSVFCPIIIDSPNQQEQDYESRRKILEFIKNKRPNKSQLILGTVDLDKVQFDGKIIELNRKNSLLLEEEYDSCYPTIINLLDKIEEQKFAKR
jgi:DNA repair exonuclease SbcCD ATPase subunit